jgi:hypothetical protein
MSIDKYKILADFTHNNIKVLAENQKEYNRHLETTENVVLAFARALKLSPKDLAKMIMDVKANHEYNESLGKELGMFKKEVIKKTTCGTNKQKKIKKNGTN